MKIFNRMMNLIILTVLLVSAISLTAFADADLVSGIGFVKGSFLRLRQGPSTGTAQLDTAYSKDCVVILGQEGDWYKVIFNLKSGYMHKDYLDVKATENAELGYGSVTADAVNLRQGPGTNYNRVTTATAGEKCYIIGVNQGWYKVIYKNDIVYIRSDYLELTEIPYENQATNKKPMFFRTGVSTGILPSAAALNGTTEAAPKVSATGAQVVATAQKYLGCPYVYGGATPSGFDCSGFTYYVLKTLGFSPDRTPAGQYSMGSPVSKDQMQPGDIVFFAGTGASGISHVGIYVGNGQFIHAPNSSRTVSYDTLTTGYWSEHFYGARRVA